MNAFLKSHQKIMKTAMKEVEKHDQALKSLSTWWEKIALIGKINSFEVASTILEDMDNTLEQFNTLQKRLIESLVNEHTKKIMLQNSSRCQMAIDVLIRNLFERTADIGFLSTDYDIIRFLTKPELYKDDRSFIQQRLQAYISIYSVYNDALLLTPDGELMFQLSQPSRTGKVSDPILQQAIDKPNDYVEYFGETEITGEPNANLLYANAVVENGEVVGVIVLCFRLENEMRSIIKRLLSEGEQNHFLLLDGAGKIIFAPQCSKSELSSRIALNTSPQIVHFNNKRVVKICAKGQAYQDYSGPQNWHIGSVLSIEKIANEANLEKKEEKKKPTILNDFTGLISADLFDIRSQSITINDDLQLIVLNGIITSARKEAVEFMPVLESIKKIGQDIDDVFDKSIGSLFSTIISGQMNAIRLQASLAVDIMDRNLFERANDCRWWGLSSLLRMALSKPEIDQECIKLTLSKIHSLYTVYHTLYVYDKQGRYIAFSDEQYNHCIGQNIEERSGFKDIFQLKTLHEYTVSPFEAFDCYQGESTYIYNAALRDMHHFNEIIGGIGIVFDSTVEFNAILNDIMPRENGLIKSGSKALFTTEKGAVIASTSVEHTIGSTFLPKIDMAALHDTTSISAAIQLDNIDYLVGAAKSTGYREYKREDGYENTIIAWVLIPC